MNRIIYLSTIIFLSMFLPNNLKAQEIQITNEYKENTIKEISVLIRRNYVLKEKRNDIASKLSKIYQERLYDTIKTAYSFAYQFTSDLYEISNDGHFAIMYDPSRVAEMRIEDDDEPNKEELKLLEESQKRRLEERKRNNFGFKKVEILSGNIGYLDFRSFRSDSLALETAHGAMSFLSNSDALIIDLRKNHGGSAAMLKLLASYFFDETPILLGEIYNGLSDETQQFWTNPDIAQYKIPEIDLYILISKKTYSAAEEFAYDLQQLKRATIVGEHSGGGAHMVTEMIINDDFYIFMPFAGAINPITKSNWEGVGVLPDYEVSAEKALITSRILILQKFINETSDEEYKKKLETLLIDLK
ncbi:S41 family peptidase [Lentimicrobium sp. S6]|uniref:S41 family peptidase n=1 Tax=Lentimicrobium sp. S6 TaxID=2735872 RepID=UPI0015564665|nr:S41 family peptidase [Lentimicrobium sp. S6]NPD47285.1 S41 family peptidase [Lentimicrobium sp. S6]